MVNYIFSKIQEFICLILVNFKAKTSPQDREAVLYWGQNLFITPPVDFVIPINSKRNLELFKNPVLLNFTHFECQSEID